MIAALIGLVDSLHADYAVLNVQGVGYKAFASGRTLTALPTDGSMVRLHIITHVREDHIHLYGFIDQAELDCFEILTGVQGVGGRVALSILSVLPPDQLQQVILAQDKAMLTRADGVGPKLALRILTELKDKMGKRSPIALATSKADSTITAGIAYGSDNALLQDAVSALTNLGYGRLEAMTVVARQLQDAEKTPDLSGLIRQSLKDLAA